VWDAEAGERLTLFSGGSFSRSLSFFTLGSRLLCCGSDGTAAVWDLSPDERPFHELKILATVLSARVIDGTESLVPAEPEAFRAAWQALRAIHAKGLPVSADRAAAWHLDQAAACELDKDARALKLHLDQAERLLPGDPRVNARRRQAAASSPVPDWLRAAVKTLSPPEVEPEGDSQVETEE
jgi:hypothetical protein